MSGATADVPLDAAPSSLSRRARIATGFAAIAVALAVYAPVLYYMVLHWKLVPDYSHGFLVAPLAVLFAWERKRDLAAAPIDGSWLGLVPLSLGALALAIGRLGVELTAMRSGFVLTLIGLVLLLFGRQVFRILAFPLLFLFLMVPLPQSLVNVVAFPLQLVAANWAVDGLRLSGVPALVEGNIIHLPNAQLYVAEACSGLRSLMALLTLGVVFAKFFRRDNLERVVLVVSTIPIAILVNAMRVWLTGLLTSRYGESVASGVIHEFQGLITFTVAFLVLLLLSRLISVVRPSTRPSLARRPA